jgi:hypothetical protein
LFISIHFSFDELAGIHETLLQIVEHVFAFGVKIFSDQPIPFQHPQLFFFPLHTIHDGGKDGVEYHPHSSFRIIFDHRFPPALFFSFIWIVSRILIEHAGIHPTKNGFLRAVLHPASFPLPHGSISSQNKAAPALCPVVAVITIEHFGDDAIFILHLS